MLQWRVERFDAIILAGGRIDGEYAQAAGTTVKALVRIGSSTILHRVLEAVSGSARVDRVAVVGPRETNTDLTSSQTWTSEHRSALENVLAGLDALKIGGASTSDRVLICASDTPMLTASAIDELLTSAHSEADLAIPVVSADTYLSAYPHSPATFIRLRGGRYTVGSQIVARKQAMLRNSALFERMFRRRKSQLAMAALVGPVAILEFLAGRLTIADIEARASSITGCAARCVMNSAPELAFDVDELDEWRDACARLTQSSPPSPFRSNPRDLP